MTAITVATCVTSGDAGDGDWRTPPAKFVHSAAEVHVWRIPLARSAVEERRFRGVLSSDEINRAERLASPDQRRRFVVARGSLRGILACYLDMTPAGIRFEYGPHGKPQLEGSHGLERMLHFNTSHSGELALIAVTGAGAVGIDVEQVRNDCACAQIAHHYFSAGESAQLENLDPLRRTEEFFRCWTLKEAFVKGTGRGLSLALDHFDVLRVPGSVVSRPDAPLDPAELAHWSLRELNAGAGYAASLAVRKHACRVLCWNA